MSDESFFDQITEQSEVKTDIVYKYFSAWAEVIIKTIKNKPCDLGYIDLYSGPGKYDDGTYSTPLKILQKAINHNFLRQRLKTVFNDNNQVNVSKLIKAIDELPNITLLNHKPEVFAFDVGDQIASYFRLSIPSLYFIDPWGYKGLSLTLFSYAIKQWGSDCILFFNYNRINMAIDNPAVKGHMQALFGYQRVASIQAKIKSQSPENREVIIIQELSEALHEIGGKYVLPFRFVNKNGNRPSHHLFFITKNLTGYKIMKEIMAKESSHLEQGVPTLEYNPLYIQQPTLFDLNRPLDELEEDLLKEFSGKTMKMSEIFIQHNVGKRYIEKNYKEVLKRMEKEGKIIAIPPFTERPKATFGPNVIVVFPKK